MSERVSIEELRAKIEAYRTGIDTDARTLHPDAVARNIGRHSDAWKAAYLWHVGVTAVLMKGFPLGGGRAEMEEHRAFEREHAEGTKLIRECGLP